MSREPIPDRERQVIVAVKEAAVTPALLDTSKVIVGATDHNKRLGLAPGLMGEAE